MKTIELSGGKIKIYEDIKELPIQRYKDFQKYLLQDSGIGSTMADVDRHFKMIDRFLAAGKLNEAKQERDNLHMNLFMMLEKISILDIAFVCLIHSINNEPIYDTTEENLRRISERLGKMGLTKRELEEITNEVKKKFLLA